MSNSYYHYLNKEGDVIQVAFDKNNSEIINFISYVSYYSKINTNCFKLSLTYCHNVYDLLTDSGKRHICMTDLFPSVLYYRYSCIIKYILDEQNDELSFSNVAWDKGFHCIDSKNNEPVLFNMSDCHFYEDFFNFSYNIKLNFIDLSRISVNQDNYTDYQKKILVACYRTVKKLKLIG